MKKLQKKTVDRGNESFQNALNSKIYVDKTGLLKYTNEVIGTEQNRICVSRPRRFGKSMAADMISAYYDKSCDSKELFDGYRISKEAGYERHLNQYRVIHLDISLDDEICSMLDYFEIFLERMLMCRRAAEVLGVRFKLTANGSKVL